MMQKIVEEAVTNKIEFIHRNLRHAEYGLHARKYTLNVSRCFYPAISKPVGVKW